MKLIWQFIVKFWYIAAMVIIYLVVDISGLIPGFGFFKRSAIHMLETPVVVKEIKKINQLVSAEYYGEVYGDLYEGYEQLLFSKLDTIHSNHPFYNDYPRLKKYEELKATIADLKQEGSLMGARIDTLVKQNKNSEVERMQEKISNLHQDLREAKNDLQELKKERNLVYIGRGWVKAGFDFGALQAKNLEIGPRGKDTVEVSIPAPKVLDADINPWFIPDQVKGYELFMNQSDGEPFTSEEILMVKQLCKHKLKTSALEKGILDKARSSGKNSLTSFFQLMDFKQVQVRIHE